MAITINGGSGDGQLTGNSSGFIVTSTTNVVTTSPATGALVVPVGTTAQRSATQGAVRFNSDNTLFEIYNGSSWGNVVTSLTVTPAAISGQNNSATSYLAIPQGTTAQRPTGVTDGYLRFNTSTQAIETYFSNTSAWANIASPIVTTSFNVQSLLIGGGGGGGFSFAGGGGGAGGFLLSNSTVTANTAYTIVIGAGGPGGDYGQYNGYNGQNTTFSTNIAIGGGGGGVWNNSQPGNGGSGGGGGPSYPSSSYVGAGTGGQGNPGGSGYRDSNQYMAAGGGGGAGATGGSSSGQYSGGGGRGSNSSITGVTITFAGGGGGGGCQYSPYQSYYGGGGSGGGGPGGQGQTGGSGGGNSGGGGGGGGANSGAAYNVGGTGGSGVAILAYAGQTVKASGGTINVVAASNTVTHTFYTSGTFQTY